MLNRFQIIGSYFWFGRFFSLGYFSNEEALAIIVTKVAVDLL